MSDIDTIKGSDHHPDLAENDILVTSAQKRYFASEECRAAREVLERIMEDPRYNTDSDLTVENESVFINRHLKYLSRHPQIKYEGYITNLKLMISIRRA